MYSWRKSTLTLGVPNTNNPTKNNTAMPETTKKNISKEVKRMFGLDLHAWEHLLIAGSAITAIGAIIAVVSTVGVVMLQRTQLRDAATAFEKYKEGVAVEVSTANAIGETAKAEAAKAIAKGLELGNSNLKLQTDLEKERTQRLKLEEKLAPRRISEWERKLLIDGLRAIPRKLNFNIHVVQDPETEAYANDLVDTIVHSGTDVSTGVAFFVGATPMGIKMKFTNEKSPDSIAIKKAFESANIKFTSQNEEMAPGFDVLIRVGRKP